MKGNIESKLLGACISWFSSLEGHVDGETNSEIMSVHVRWSIDYPTTILKGTLLF